MRWLVPVVAVCALASTARATVVSVPSLEEMAVASELIADVTAVDQRVTRDHSGRIVTLTTLAVNDGWKGAKTGGRITLFQLGGTLDATNAWIVGATHFHVGDRFVLFGDHHVGAPADEVVTYGIGFGTFAVQADPTGAVRDPVVVESVGDVVDFAGGAPAARKYDSLPAFKVLVERALAFTDAPHPRLLQKLGPQLTAQGGH
jgi:hypothetical protein